MNRLVGEKSPTFYFHITTKNIKVMIYYSISFDDGEHIKNTNTLEEAEQYRNDNNWRFMSRSIRINQVCVSKCTGFHSEKRIRG